MLDRENANMTSETDRAIARHTEDCVACCGRAYLIVTRGEGRTAVERCDSCAAGVLSDQQAAILARYDGIECTESYPCYVKE
jgi:hypothetical protein